MCDEIVWIERPQNLIRDFRIFPPEDAEFGSKINSLTRLLIVICVILALFKWKYWYVVLIVGLLIIMNVYLVRNEEIKPNSKLREKLFLPMKGKMDVPVSSFYTKVRIPDNPNIVSLEKVGTLHKDSKAPEVLTLVPKVANSNRTVRKPIKQSPQQPAFKLKGFGKSIAPKQTRSAAAVASDLMKAKFDELDEGSQADLDTQNMSNLLL